MASQVEAVSDPAESLILVDSEDNILGYKPKEACHLGDGILHRAFSVFLFDREGRLLLQQRAPGKMLWPGIWANSCCSHPRQGEEDGAAAHRRTREELGVQSSLSFLYRFEYHARDRDVGSEHELCSVWIGRLEAEPVVHPEEIAATKRLAPAELDAELEAHPDKYSPWLHLEWRAIRAEHWPAVQALWQE